MSPRSSGLPHCCCPRRILLTCLHSCCPNQNVNPLGEPLFLFLFFLPPSFIECSRSNILSFFFLEFQLIKTYTIFKSHLKLHFLFGTYLDQSTNRSYSLSNLSLTRWLIGTEHIIFDTQNTILSSVPFSTCSSIVFLHYQQARSPAFSGALNLQINLQISLPPCGSHPRRNSHPRPVDSAHNPFLSAGLIWVA